MTRDERQELCRINWIKSKCKGTIEACTGFGKTRCAVNCIKSILNKYPDKKILIVVPTNGLKEQWLTHIENNSLQLNAEVQIINTVIKHEWICDLLILDEIHRCFAEQLSQVFNVVKYKYILGLTATVERLDGKHVLIEKYCPICDRVTLLEAQINGWVSNFKEYQVLLDVDDIDIYKQYNKDFISAFETFNFDFNLAMNCIGPKGFINRAKLRDEICKNGGDRKQVFQNITFNSMKFMRAIQKRKAFINNHPKKLELTRKIIEARPNSKIITFSNNIKMAESIGIGYVYTGKESKKKNRITLDEFNALDSGVLCTSQMANEGLDLPNLSIAIMLGIDSSKIKAVQRIGRVIRKEGDKQAEIFNLIINDTVETSWFAKAHPDKIYTTIDENGLMDVLEYKEPKLYRKKIKDFQFRY